MQIGIFGGSFNPPHKMHIDIALNLIKLNYLDKVIFVPTGDKYYKKELANSADRINMLKIICNENNNLDVSDYEIKKNLVYTYQTLNFFKSLYPNDEIIFILGADNLNELEKWKNYKYLLENFKFLVVKRYGENIDDIMKKYKQYISNIVITDISTNSVSSTRIRNMIKNEDNDLSKYLNEEVIKYINSKKLYI